MLEHQAENTSHGVFKRVRTCIQKYYAVDIIMMCAACLNRPDANQVERVVHFPPFLILLLIKWTLAFGQYWKNKTRLLTEDEFARLVNLMHELHSTGRPLGRSMLLYMRKFAFQQLYLQHPANVPSVARQSLLFGALPPDHYIPRTFLTVTGITICDFVELGLALITKYFTQPTLTVDEGWFENILHAYPGNAVGTFLSALSLDLSEARKRMVEHSRQHSIAFQLFEQTPLTRRPLLKIGESYVCYSPMLLSHALQYFVYDTVREYDPSSFMDRFGTIFQRYVQRLMDSVHISYVDEEAMQHRLGSGCKAVDFMVTGDAASVFVEAKGVEMGYLGKVTENAEKVLDRTQTSVVRAVKQVYALTEMMDVSEAAPEWRVAPSSRYLLIVTYSNLYVGTGRDFDDNVAREEFDALIAAHGGLERVPLEHIYCISIDEFEALCQYCSAKGVYMSSTMADIVARDSDITTKRFMLQDHLGDESTQPLSLLDQEFVRIFDSLANKLRQHLP